MDSVEVTKKGLETKERGGTKRHRQAMIKYRKTKGGLLGLIGAGYGK